MGLSVRAGIIALVLLLLVLLVLPLFAACSSDDGTSSQADPPIQADPSSEDSKSIVITIGNLTDRTGPSANAMAPIDMALEDMARYCNDENLIPGVELEVLVYDGQDDPSLDIPGYEWLKEKGADVFWTPVPATCSMLKYRLEQDGMVMFTPSASTDDLIPPSPIFMTAVLPKHIAYTLLQWIAENDWDYAANGPAKIGAADWNIPYCVSMHEGLQEYCEAHPDQFEWVGGHLIDFGFNWQAEARAIADCDYVMAPIAMPTFVKEYRQAGFDAKFIGADAQTSFLGLISDANLWEQIDGMLFLRTSRWWNEQGELVDLCKDLLQRYRSEDADDLMKSSGYLAMNQTYQVMQIIADAIATVGVEGFNSKALYQAAESFSLTAGDLHFSFGPGKRTSIDGLAMYEVKAVEKNMFRLHDEWISVVRES